VDSPHEPKIGILRVFPVLAEIYRREKEPEMGVFPLKIETLIFPVSSTEDKWGRIHSFILLFVHYLIFDLLSGEEDHRHPSARVHTAPKKERFLYFSLIWGALKPVFFLLYKTIPGA